MNENGRDAAVRGLREYRENLLAEIQSLKHDLNAVDRSIELLNRQKERAALSEAVTNEYEGLGATKAVIRLLSENPGKRFTAGQARTEVERRGFSTKSENIYNLISTTLNRLANEKRIRRDRETEPMVFWTEKEADTNSASLTSQTVMLSDEEQKQALLPTEQQG